MAVLAATLLLHYVTKTRLALTCLAALGFFAIAPCWDVSWHIEWLKFQSLSGLRHLDIEMDVGVRVWVSE
jgi:hypothetical protein